MATSKSPARGRRSRPLRVEGTTHPLRIAALAIGAVFLLVGVAGFIPGITSDLDTLEFAGNDSTAELLGLFQVSVLHNIVHLLFGVLGIVAARTVVASKLFLIGGGAVYLVLTLYGAVIDLGEDINFVPLNTADNWLHLALGLAMITVGVALDRLRSPAGAT